jgi:hypothetical protein
MSGTAQDAILAALNDWANRHHLMPGSVDLKPELARYLAQLLPMRGWALVQLPEGEPISFGSLGDGLMFTIGDERQAVYAMPDGSVQTALSDRDEGDYTRGEAAEIAAALLAAVVSVEPTDQGGKASDV